MIKSTGIVRRLDDLGRIVLPKELRRVMGLQEGASVEIFTQGETVMLRRYEPLCVFCGTGGSMVQYRGKQVCSHCRNELAEPTPAA